MLDPEHIRNRIEAAFRPGPAAVMFREGGATLEVSVFALTGRLLFPEVQVSQLVEPADLERFIDRVRSVLLESP